MPDISEEDYLAVVDLIGEAALDASAWLPLLRRLASLTSCVAGGLTVENPSSGEGGPLAYFGFDAGHVEKTFAYYLPQNPLFSIAPRLQPGIIVTNGMVVPTSEFRRSEFYDGWARPQGLCSPITLVLHRQGPAYCPLTLVRRDGAGEAEAKDLALLERLSAQLQRAFRTSRQLAAQQQCGAALNEALDHLASAVVLLDANGRLTYANPAAERLAETHRAVVLTRHRTLAACGRQADAALQTAIRAVLAAPGRRVLDVPISQPSGRPLCATVMALSHSVADGLMGAPAALIMIREPDAFSHCAAAERAARIYGLTPAETRLLATILDGRGLGAAAIRLGIGRATAQTQLNGIFGKTGARRQGEVIGLVLSLASRRTG